MDRTYKRGNSLKKVFSIVGFVLSLLIFLLAILVAVSAIIAKKNNKPISIFSCYFSIVASPSMEPEILVGDFVAIKSCDISEVTVGQNIVYVSIDTSSAIYGERVIHRVKEVGEDDEGIYLITYGINNDVDDAYPVRADNFVGRELFHSTAIGKVYSFFSKIENWIFLIVLIVVLCVIVKITKKLVVYIKEAKIEGSDKDGD
jgi:signal peptidase